MLRRFAITAVFCLLPLLAHAEGINLNTASVETLTALDGIGQAKAEAIVAHREANGPFGSVEELTEVRGVGPATLEQNLERIVVE